MACIDREIPPVELKVVAVTGLVAATTFLQKSPFFSPAKGLMRPAFDGKRIFLPKRIKSFEKGVDKREKRWYYVKAVSRRCRCGGSHLRTAPVSIPVRTLKIKQCMTSTKHTQYPLIPPRKREESGIVKTMPNKDAKERREQQAQKRISTAERLW